VGTLVVSQATHIFEVSGSNQQWFYFFLTIKTTNTVSQADMWAQPNTCIQGDMCAEFKIEFEFKFMQDLQ
jgi:hypothetical protein